MRRKRKGNFRFIFFVYVCVLIVACAAALVYVGSALREYEKASPRHLVDEAVENLRAEAADGTLWTRDGVPDMIGGKYESSADTKADFMRRIAGEVTYTQRTQISESECRYGIKADGFEIAEVILRAVGEPRQKLAIITINDYELVSYRPIVHNYTITVPSFVKIGDELTFSVNGTSLTADAFVEDSVKGTATATLDGIYSKPSISVSDKNGNVAAAGLPAGADGEVDFDSTLYELVLPSELEVYSDSVRLDGAPCADGRFTYSIRLARKSVITLRDLYGNTVEYGGGSSVPLTYTTIVASPDMKITADGVEIPSSAVTFGVNPDYELFEQYVTDLPKNPTYSVVVLRDDAKIECTDASGNVTTLDASNKLIDLTASDTPSDGAVPTDIASEINVLNVLESWSLFMSNDLDFYTLSAYLIPDSSQYNVASAYNSSIDKTFTSIHTLLDPAFTDESVTNFVRIGDNCFSVDISFVKHMKLSTGALMDDSMNERCYFVKYDSTNNYVNDPTWKLVGMKEIVNDGK